MIKRSVQSLQKSDTQRRPDRRIRRTKEALRDALLSLLPEAGWDEIDVAMLCERANIGRSTFYLHYTDKTALLRGTFSDLQDHVLASIDAEDKAKTKAFPFLTELLDHVQRQQEVFRSLLGRRSCQAVQDQMRDMLISLFQRSREPDAPSDPASSCRAHMLAGCLMQLMVWWLGSAWELTPEEIKSRFLGFAVGSSASF